MKTKRENKSTLYPNEQGFHPDKPVTVGGTLLSPEPITYNANRRSVTISVTNTGDRPIQVGSHFHFFEVNRYLLFDREAAFGCHLNIPATTAIRFEPGDTRKVELVTYGGKRRIVGFNSLVDGYAGDEDTPCYLPNRTLALHRMRRMGFMTTQKPQDEDKKPTDTNGDSNKSKVSKKR